MFVSCSSCPKLLYFSMCLFICCSCSESILSRSCPSICPHFVSLNLLDRLWWWCKCNSSILRLVTASIFAVLLYMYSATWHHIPEHLSLSEHEDQWHMYGGKGCFWGVCRLHHCTCWRYSCFRKKELWKFNINLTCKHRCCVILS